MTRACCRRLPVAWLLGWLIAAGGCGGGSRPNQPAPADPAAAARAAPPSGPQLVNDEFTVVRMSTAHGAFVVELETARPERIGEYARTLAEPIKSRYEEILIYATRPAGDKPARRVVWTPRNGYVELDYEAK